MSAAVLDKPNIYGKIIMMSNGATPPSPKPWPRSDLHRRQSRFFIRSSELVKDRPSYAST